MKHLLTIALHEFKRVAANRAFLIMTLLGPFLILAITVLPSLLTQSSMQSQMSQSRSFVLFTEDAALRAALTAIGSSSERAAEAPVLGLVDAKDDAQALKLLDEGKIDAIVYADSTWNSTGQMRVLTKKGQAMVMRGMISQLVSSYEQNRRLAQAGLDMQVLQGILNYRPVLQVEELSRGGERAEQSEQDFTSLLFTALTFVMLLYMTILLYGQGIGRSVVLEKTSKTVEIMLSSVKPTALMFGKILGPALAGFLQYVFWIVLTMVGLELVGPAFGIALGGILSLSKMIWLLVFFLLAFFLYSAFFAALGAASEDEQHMGQLSFVLIFFLMVPLLMISPLVTNPDQALVVGMSIFPLTSPIVMFVRILVSEPWWYEIVISLILLVLTIIGVGFAGAKIFRVGILMSGKRVKLGEILRWLKVK